MGDGGFFHHHEVLQAPVLFGITEGELDLEPQLVIVTQDIPGQAAIAAEEIAMCLFARGLLLLDDHNHVQRLVKRLMTGFDLIDPRLDAILHGGLLQVARGDRGRVEPLPLDPMRAATGIRASIRIVQGRVAAQLGDQLQAEPTGHQDGIVVAKMPIEHQIGQPERCPDAGQQALDHRTDARVFGIQRRISLGLGAAAFGTPRFPRRHGQGRGRRAGWFVQHLLHLHRERLPFATTDQGQREERDPRHGLAKDTRKEAIHAVGLRPGFRHHPCIADEQDVLTGGQHLGPQEDPEDCGPGQGRMKEALDGAIAATRSGPARAPQHRDPSRHHEHGQHNPAQLTYGGHRHHRMEAAHP